MAAKEKGKGFIAEFKQFIARGNVFDMAVGVVIGGAFGKITTSIVNDIIMPLVSMLTGGVNFSEWKLVLKEAVMAADGVTVDVPAVSINFGSLIAVIVDFIIIALVIFCMVKAINTLREKAEAAKKAEEEAAPVEEPAPPEPSAEEKLLTEIRDLLKEKR